MIIEIHGTIENVDRTRMSHRRMLNRANFLQWAGRQRPLVTASEASRGLGTAITIDDGTVAAMETALLLREMGHEVTVFVNPHYVIAVASYPFHVLSAALDELAGRRVSYQKQLWDLQDRLTREALRQCIKRELLAQRTNPAYEAVVLEFLSQVGLTGLSMPPHLRPIDAADVVRLVEKRVAVENHGWTHLNFESLCDEERRSNVMRGAEWLRGLGAGMQNLFAVPYGKVWPSQTLGLLDCALWMLADRTLKSGLVGPGLFNRASIDADAELQ